MKKITVVQAGFIAIVALAAGLLIGILITGTSPSEDMVAGTFGKAEKFKKVIITDKDIILRNDLAGDTNRLSRYEKYLSYNYYKSLKTSVEFEKVIKMTATEEEFNKTYRCTNALAGFNTYLTAARRDLIKGIYTLKTVRNGENVAVTDDINNAEKTITRIRYHDQILLDYLSTVETYLADRADQTHQGLKGAYDLLTINLLQTAMITKNKPMLKYLGDKKFYNDNQGMKALLAEVQLRSETNSMVAQDTLEMNGFNEIYFQQIIVSLDKLDAAFSEGFVLTKSELGNNSMPDVGEIIKTQDRIVGTFMVTEMQGIVGQALTGICTPFCVN